MKWYVLKTKPSVEIKVAKALNNIGINTFCPIVEIVKNYSDRKKKVQKPALPSYVLVNISEKDRSNVFHVPGVVKYLFWLGKPAEVKSDEIEILKKELKNLYDINLKIDLNRNSNLIIEKGPFKGQEGKILNISKNKLKLELKNIGIYVSLNLA